jgi:hypothetical protein
MARNIVQEKREAERNKAQDEKDAKEIKAEVIGKPSTEEKEIVYITTEQVTLNNLNVIMAQLENLNKLVAEGFKQVGVTFEEAKDL